MIALSAGPTAKHRPHPPTPTHHLQVSSVCVCSSLTHTQNKSTFYRNQSGKLRGCVVSWWVITLWAAGCYSVRCSDLYCVLLCCARVKFCCIVFSGQLILFCCFLSTSLLPLCSRRPLPLYFLLSFVFFFPTVITSSFPCPSLSVLPCSPQCVLLCPLPCIILFSYILCFVLFCLLQISWVLSQPHFSSSCTLLLSSAMLNVVFSLLFTLDLSFALSCLSLYVPL